MWKTWHSRTDHRWQYNTAHALSCWINKATDTHSEYVILIALHGNDNHKNAPQCYGYTNIVCLFCNSVYFPCKIYLCVLFFMVNKEEMLVGLFFNLPKETEALLLVSSIIMI